MQRTERLTTRQLVISYGHTDTHVVIQMSHETNNLQLTPAEVDAFLDNVQKIKVMLLEHQQNPKPVAEAVKTNL